MTSLHCVATTSMLPRTHLSLNHHLHVSVDHCSTAASPLHAAGSPEEVHYEVPGAVPLPVPLTVPLVLSVRPRLLALPATDCFELALIVAKIIYLLHMLHVFLHWTWSQVILVPSSLTLCTSPLHTRLFTTLQSPCRVCRHIRILIIITYIYLVRFD